MDIWHNFCYHSFIMAQNSFNNGCLWALLILLLFPGLIILIPVFMFLFGMGTVGLFAAAIGFFAVLPAVLSAFLSAGWISLLLFSLCVAIILPVVFVIYALVRLIRGNGLPKWQAWLAALLIWLLSVLGVVSTGVHTIHEAGGIHALGEELSSQLQSWDYSWSYSEDSLSDDSTYCMPIFSTDTIDEPDDFDDED